MSFQLTEHQLKAVESAKKMDSSRPRLCLYYKTGAGKSLTALECLRVWGHDSALVIAPPSTHDQWTKLGRKLDMELTLMSHAKFRMKTTKLDRTTAIVADEMHLFGGVQGAGWRKLERVGKTLDAPLVLASATPNYNDAERVYCIHRILDPVATAGGYLEFLYQHCDTAQNPFGITPNVVGFKNHESAADYLAALEHVEYLPDDTVLNIQEIVVIERLFSDELAALNLGYDKRNHRMIASIIERMHAMVQYQILYPSGVMREYVTAALDGIADTQPGKIMLFAVHSSIAEALAAHYGPKISVLVTGKMSTKQKTAEVQRFISDPDARFLIGTASLATGTDGLDKVCDTMIIVDDTDDDALRRQLMGRILPRGLDTDASGKKFFVFQYS